MLLGKPQPIGDRLPIQQSWEKQTQPAFLDNTFGQRCPALLPYRSNSPKPPHRWEGKPGSWDWPNAASCPCPARSFPGMTRPSRARARDCCTSWRQKCWRLRAPGSSASRPSATLPPPGRRLCGGGKQRGASRARGTARLVLPVERLRRHQRAAHHHGPVPGARHRMLRHYRQGKVKFKLVATVLDPSGVLAEAQSPAWGNRAVSQGAQDQPEPDFHRVAAQDLPMECRRKAVAIFAFLTSCGP